MSDFKSIDVNFRVDDGDSGYWPSQYLGAAIASMLNNYPYAKNDYDLQPKQLLDWLSKIDKLEMKAK